jgi:hypothetical protein
MLFFDYEGVQEQTLVVEQVLEQVLEQQEL